MMREEEEFNRMGKEDEFERSGLRTVTVSAQAVATKTQPPLCSPRSSLASPSLPQSNWVKTANDVPIPPSSLRTSDFPYDGDFVPPQQQQQYSRALTASSSFRSNHQAPSSWGGTSYLFLDEETVNGDDGLSERGTDVGSVAGLSYARKRRLLRHMSKASVKKSTSSKRHSLKVKEKWSRKLEDFREYEVGIFKSLLPLKAATAAGLASCLCFAPFIPELLTFYGTVAVLGVGMSLESNVGLTLQKGSNLMLGSALAGLIAFIVNLIEPFTGNFHVYYMITCVFLGGSLPRLITLPTIIKTRWAQTLTYYISVFHGLILNTSIRIEYTGQFFLNCLFYSSGFVLVLLMTLFIKPDYAGDALLVLLVSDFHTAGVVLERIVEDYRGGIKLTNIQELLSGVVTEDHIHHDLQYIIKSTEEAEKLMNAVKWEPSHGKFFKDYPWDLYPTLLAMLLHVMYDLIALDSALRAEIQAPLDIRQLFADDMETVATECSMLFHKVGDALHQHKKIDYNSNVERARLATLNLRTKLSLHARKVIAQDIPWVPIGSQLTRTSSRKSIKDLYDELDSPNSPKPTPPPSPPDFDRIVEQDREDTLKLNINEDDWRARLFLRRRSICEHYEETQQHFSSLSFIKFATILIELMAKVKIVVTMVDDISVQARFTEVELS